MATDKIQQTIESFVNDIRRLLAEQARDSLLAALSGEQPPTQRRGPGRPRAAAKPAKAAAKPAKKSGKRVRRTAADLEAIQGKIVATLKARPGATSEQLQEALGMSKSDVQRPLVLLREENKVKAEGEKRGMRYYAKGRG